MNRSMLRVSAGLLVFLHSVSAFATWSIGGIDEESGYIGAASATCYEFFGHVYTDILNHDDIYTPIPNASVIIVQQAFGFGNTNNFSAENISLAAKDAKTASEILELGTVKASFFQRKLNDLNQYGIISLNGGAAAYTGEYANGGWLALRKNGFSNEASGQEGSYQYSVFGNTLSSPEVVRKAAEAFKLPACDLADRLMNALEAGGSEGTGDIRCVTSSVKQSSATEAFIRVERPVKEDPLRRNPYLFLEVEGRRGAVGILAGKFNEWRKKNPCE